MAQITIKKNRTCVNSGRVHSLNSRQPPAIYTSETYPTQNLFAGITVTFIRMEYNNAALTVSKGKPVPVKYHHLVMDTEASKRKTTQGEARSCGRVM